MGFFLFGYTYICFKCFKSVRIRVEHYIPGAMIIFSSINHTNDMVLPSLRYHIYLVALLEFSLYNIARNSYERLYTRSVHYGRQKSFRSYTIFFFFCGLI